MLRAAKRLTPALTHSPRAPIGFFRTLLHLLRTALNRVRWEENQQFTALEKRSSTVPKSAEEATQLFLATQKQVSLSEEGRLQRIDQILGTKTYFHQGKVYHERIDSDHLMEIEQLKKENPETKRKELNWLNPQSDMKIKYKNKRNYYQLVSKLATYPHHQQGTYDLSNETNQQTIAFLATETAYSTISLKPMELTAGSLQQQAMVLPPEAPFVSQRYSYFRPQFSMQLLRTLYSAELLQDASAIEALGPQVQEVISLDEIYEALKQFDTDQRVHEYLRKVENKRVEYLFTDICFDSAENKVAITIDLLDNGAQHCLLVKSLASKEATLRPIFNMKPPVAFSSDGNTIFYIQRSAEGGWIELVKRAVESCWGENEVMVREEEEDEGIVFRGAPEKELRLGSDSNSRFVFLIISDYGKQYSQNLFLISSREDSLNLLPVDEDGKCAYFYDMSPQGLIYARKKKVESGTLKYGNNSYYIDSLYHIPFKHHIQLQTQQQQLGLTQLPGSVADPVPPGPEQLDFSNKKCIFLPNEHQFITQVQVRQSHIVMVLNYASVYDKAILYFLPFKPSAHPHSLILKGGSELRLKRGSNNFDNQEVEFVQPQGAIQLERVYSIWKKELRQNQREAAKYHRQTMVIEDGPHPFELHFLCKELYIEEKNLPVVLVMTDKGEELDQQVLRQFLEKGVAVIQFCGRGTFTKDLQHFLAGSRHNFGSMLDDLKTAIQFIGNRITTNISLYCKGEINSLAGLWFNIYFPYLFNATVLHNGLYDLNDQIEVSRCADFFGNLTPTNGTGCFETKKFNIFQHQFKSVTSSQFERKDVEIRYMENMIISSDSGHRLHSRKLVKRLRENPLLQYDSVFLKEYEDGYSTDLHNLSFLYAKIRERLERELHQMPEDESQDHH